MTLVEVRPETEKKLTFEEYVRLQKEEILSELNRLGAAIFYGREVTDEDELADYYILCGAHNRFREKHKRCD